MALPVRPKKHLGQHFLKEDSIAREIVQFLSGKGYRFVLEIGPGTGILTQHLLKNTEIELFVVEIDRESVAYLNENYPELKEKIITEDFLKLDLKRYFDNHPIAIIGNFPYNISSQILFKAWHHRHQVAEIVGMFQKEVAERVAAPPGSKTYGILSVLMQAFYKVEMLLQVPPEAFIPPPKVDSAVIRLRRNEVEKLPCDETLFFKVIKQAFQQRRKKMRNSLKSMIGDDSTLEQSPLLQQRPEQLSVDQFIKLTRLIDKSRK